MGHFESVQCRWALYRCSKLFNSNKLSLSVGNFLKTCMDHAYKANLRWNSSEMEFGIVNLENNQKFNTSSFLDSQTTLPWISHNCQQISTTSTMLQNSKSKMYYNKKIKKQSFKRVNHLKSPCPFMGANGRNSSASRPVQDLSVELTSRCFKKCIGSKFSSGKFEKGEEACVLNCVDRFFDSHLYIVQRYVCIGRALS
jgi:hypothetical protein